MKNTNLVMYISYDEPFNGKAFTSNQMHEVYRDLVDKTEYQDFKTWLYDMLKSGVFEFCEASNAYETEKRMIQLLNDFNIVNPYTIAIEQFISKLVYTTHLFEYDALELMKEYCLYGTLSLNKYNL